MKIVRRKTKVVKIGEVKIGGTYHVAIQSMAKTKTSRVEETVKQIKALEKSGCEIVRVAVKDAEDARGIKKIKAQARIPIVADIHFDWCLAIQAIESGVDKIRLNPGNIYKKEEIKEIVSAAKGHRIPIRVGVNSGSLAGRRPQAAGRMTHAEKMVKSALEYIRVLEGFKFDDIVVSLKASNTLDTIEGYRKIARACDYPMHLGVTATGAPYAGAIKSGIALGALLLEGIGDTMRVSLTDEPGQEVAAAKIVLESLGLRHFGIELISCPTCGRCEVDLVGIVKELENRLQVTRLSGRQAGRPQVKPLKVAIMGCVVNGPGEAREADIGIAFGKEDGLLFKQGKPVKKVSFAQCVDALLEEIGG